MQIGLNLYFHVISLQPFSSRKMTKPQQYVGGPKPPSSHASDGHGYNNLYEYKGCHQALFQNLGLSLLSTNHNLVLDSSAHLGRLQGVAMGRNVLAVVCHRLQFPYKVLEFSTLWPSKAMKYLSNGLERLKSSFWVFC